MNAFHPAAENYPLLDGKEFERRSWIHAARGVTLYFEG